MTRWPVLLALAWTVVWVSSQTSNNGWPICPVIGNDLCSGSYIPDFKNHEITCHEGEDGCQDFVDALNQARSRRLINDSLIGAPTGYWEKTPLEIKHKYEMRSGESCAECEGWRPCK